MIFGKTYQELSEKKHKKFLASMEWKPKFVIFAFLQDGRWAFFQTVESKLRKLYTSGDSYRVYRAKEK